MKQPYKQQADRVPETENSRPEVKPQPNTESGTPHKRKRRRIITTCVLLAVTAIGLAVFFCLYPMLQFMCAAEKTVSQLQQVLEHTDRLFAFLSDCGELTDGKAYQLTASVQKNGADFFRLKETYNGGSACLSGGLTVTGGGSELSLLFAADKETLQLQAPAYLDEVFMLPQRGLGARYSASLLGTLTAAILPDWVNELDLELFPEDSSAELLQKLQDEAVALLHTVRPRKTDERILNADCTAVYRLDFDAGQGAAVLKALRAYFAAALPDALNAPLLTRLDDVRERLRDGKLLLYGGVNADGMVNALMIKGGKGFDCFTLLLCGRQNLWNEIRLYAEGALRMTVGLERTGTGVLLHLGEGLTLHNDDAARCITVSCGAISAELQYASQQGSVSADTEMTIGRTAYRAQLLLSPGEQTPELLSNEPIDLLKLSASELLGFLAKLIGVSRLPVIS